MGVMEEGSHRSDGGGRERRVMEGGGKMEGGRSGLE